jgi:hypothetical protein
MCNAVLIRTASLGLNQSMNLWSVSRGEWSWEVEGIDMGREGNVPDVVAYPLGPVYVGVMLSLLISTQLSALRSLGGGRVGHFSGQRIVREGEWGWDNCFDAMCCLIAQSQRTSNQHPLHCRHESKWGLSSPTTKHWFRSLELLSPLIIRFHRAGPCTRPPRLPLYPTALSGRERRLLVGNNSLSI